MANPSTNQPLTMPPPPEPPLPSPPTPPAAIDMPDLEAFCTTGSFAHKSATYSTSFGGKTHQNRNRATMAVMPKRGQARTVQGIRKGGEGEGDLGSGVGAGGRVSVGGGGTHVMSFMAVVV